ncbi:MAG: cholesterol oxidase, partial [Phenylobacterium sp.]
SIMGTVTAPALSDQPLAVSQGVFNLFEVYPETPDTRHMKYNMVLTSVTGESFYFSGYKVVKDGAVTDAWADNSTLYVTVYKGDNKQGEVFGKAVMHIKPADFIVQLSTITVSNAANEAEKLKSVVRFGKFFAGVLWQSYAGILYNEPRFDPDAPPRKKRPLRAGLPDVHMFNTEDDVNLRLSRYQGGTKGPVMLVHGLGVASSIFSTDTIHTNLVEYLYANDYDVWLLDFRVSIDLPAAKEQCNGDQVAKYDFPAAIDVIKQQTGCQSVQALVHCYGATTFFMSMLAGLKDVRSIVCSQIATNLVLPKSTTIKTGIHLPGFLEKIGIDSMSAYTDTNEGFLGKLYDQAVELNALAEAQGQCENPVCHRVTFLYSSLYRHETLNNKLHENLHELFGEANITTLKHLSELCRKGTLVSADGENIYMDHIDNLNLPILFISGEMNECYLPESTEITFNMLQQKFGKEQYSREVIPGYAHIDCIFGERAVDDVYPLMLAHLEKTAVSS